MSVEAQRIDTHAHDRLDAHDKALGEIRQVLDGHVTESQKRESRLAERIDGVATTTSARLDSIGGEIASLKGDMKTLGETVTGASDAILAAATQFGSATAIAWGGKIVVFLGGCAAIVLIAVTLQDRAPVVIADLVYTWSGATPGISGGATQGKPADP